MKYALGEKISRIRRAQGMTQEELASLLSISRQTVSHWENNDSQPNVEMLLRLMQVLKLEASDLLSIHTEKTQKEDLP